MEQASNVAAGARRLAGFFVGSAWLVLVIGLLAAVVDAIQSTHVNYLGRTYVVSDAGPHAVVVFVLVFGSACFMAAFLGFCGYVLRLMVVIVTQGSALSHDIQNGALKEKRGATKFENSAVTEGPMESNSTTVNKSDFELIAGEYPAIFDDVWLAASAYLPWPRDAVQLFKVACEMVRNGLPVEQATRSAFLPRSKK